MNTGEANYPYLIYTAEQMNANGAEPNDWDKHFKLMADIDMSAYSGTQFNIIGTGTAMLSRAFLTAAVIQSQTSGILLPAEIRSGSSAT